MVDASHTPPAGTNLHDEIAGNYPLAKDGAGWRGRDLVEDFVSRVRKGSMTVSSDAGAMINARIAQINQLLSLQLNEILHHPAFQDREASSRGSANQLDPNLALSVQNKLSGDPHAAPLQVYLKFESPGDFDPENVARQVKPLKALLDLRARLSDLRCSLEGNDKLEAALVEAVGNSNMLGKFKVEKDLDKTPEGGNNG